MINREAVKHFKKYMAQRIENIVVTTPSSSGYEKHSLISNIFVVSTELIYSAECLPKGHPVRRVLSKASVSGFLRSKASKLAPAGHGYSKFSTDLLTEVGWAL